MKSYIPLTLVLLAVFAANISAKPLSYYRGEVRQCHPRCGYLFWHVAGQCQPDGRCLCWWGWTGPNARYVDGGPLHNRIL